MWPVNQQQQQQQQQTQQQSQQVAMLQQQQIQQQQQFQQPQQPDKVPVDISQRLLNWSQTNHSVFAVLVCDTNTNSLCHPSFVGLFVSFFFLKAPG